MFVTRGHLHLIVCSALVTTFIPTAWSCPDQCDCDSSEQDVKCENKELQLFPLELDENVVYLSIADNFITTIPVLTKYSMLMNLNASGNQIKFLDQTVFIELRSLNHLDLSSNRITSLSDINAYDLFDTNGYLETLILSKNQISIFDENDVIRSKSLKVLDLSSNQIMRLEKNVLTYLPSLTHLHMASNPLQWVIDLQSNSLNHLDVSFGKMDGMNRDQLSRLPRLQTLKVSRNSGFNLFNDLVSSSLKFYEARHCQLTRPGLFQFENVENANLRGNKIESLRANRFIKNGKLVHLDLSLNDIDLIEQDSFLGLTNIEYLSLEENQITGITWDMFITNHELKILNLSKNPITSLPVNLTLSKLQELDLSQCRIHPLDSFTFTRIPFLFILDLSQNGIEHIANNIESNSLKVLNLSNNRLSSITNDTFSKIPNIEVLNIIGNRFTITPKQYMFNSNTRLKSIQMSDNPWICECTDQEFKELWEYLTDLSNPPPKLVLSERNELKCTSPENLMGKRWDDACSREFWPPINRSTFFDRYGVYILMTVMTISFTLVVIVSIRERMKKREKVLRTRLEARRRTVAENHERVVRLYRESVERINVEHRRQEEVSLQERVERHPPTYEEAVLMPRREESASRDELRSSRRSEYELDALRTREMDNTASEIANTHLTQAGIEPVLHRADYDEISIYSEVAEDEDEDDDEDEDVSPRGPLTITVRPASAGAPSESGNDRLDEAKLMQQLRIEVWSREDIRQEQNSNNDLTT